MLLIILFLLPFALWMFGVVLIEFFWPVLLVILVIWVVVRVVSPDKGK